MKKLINDPEGVLRDSLEGIVGGARRPRPRQLRPGLHRARRRAGAGQGRDRLRRRLGPRADARRLRRARDARRRLPGRGVHLADPGPDARGDQGGRRRRRRAAHRQELHRRRHELRDGGRARPAARASRSPRSSPTTTSRSRTASTRRGGAASASPCSRRRSAARRPRSGKSLQEVADLCRAGQRRGPRMGMALTPCITPSAGEPNFTLGDDEMEIGIGIHGEPGRERDEGRAGGEDRRAPGRGGRRRPAVQRGRQRARLRQRHGRHAADRAVHRLQRAEQVPDGPRHHDHAEPHRATTSPRWRWPAARSRCCASTTSSRGCGTRRSTRSRCAGADRPVAITHDDVQRLDEAVLRRGGGEPRAADAARRRHRRRRPRDEHGPWHEEGARAPRGVRHGRHRGRR